MASQGDSAEDGERSQGRPAKGEEVGGTCLELRELRTLPCGDRWGLKRRERQGQVTHSTEAAGLAGPESAVARTGARRP